MKIKSHQVVSSSTLLFLYFTCLTDHAALVQGIKRDYYEVLGLGRDSSDKDIKRAFRKLALKYHPDKNKEEGAEDKFREMAEAYTVLSDAEKRRQYDSFGHGAFDGATGGNTGFPFGDASFNMDDFLKHFDDDLFSNFKFESSQFNSKSQFRSESSHQHNQEEHHHHHNANRRHEQEQRLKEMGFDGVTFIDDWGEDDDVWGDPSAAHAHSGHAHPGHAHSGHAHHVPMGAFDGMNLNDLFPDESMFGSGSFASPSSSSGGSCRTVTKRDGSSVMTYTTCS